MSVYLFPKSKHVRKYRPKRVFKNYRINKPILRAEFYRTCVYCRQPDSQAQNQVFGADHYAPQSKFPNLSTTYTNLFYCCNACNTYKSNYWPVEKSDPMVLNPCSHVLSKHVRFDKSTGRIVPLSQEGAFFEEMFRLNEDGAPDARLDCLHIVYLATCEFDRASRALKRIDSKLSSATNPVEIARLSALRSDVVLLQLKAKGTIDRQTGALALPPLSKNHV